MCRLNQQFIVVVSKLNFSKIAKINFTDRPNIEKVPRTYYNRYEELFVEGVIPFVGRVFVLAKKLQDINVDDCTGTVGLIGPKGESIGAFHSVKKAWKHPRQYDVYIKYMNYDKQPCFPAKVVTYNDELDIFIAMPLPPFDFNFPKFLQPASGVAVGDTVHCLGFPKLIAKEALSLIKKLECNNNVGSEQSVKDMEFPIVFSGRVCFSGWKQVLADYRSFPNSSGAILVDDNGHLKGLHVSSLSSVEYTPELSELESGHNISERTKALYEQVNKCLPQLISGVKHSAEVAVFVPINVLMRTLNPMINPITKTILYS